MRISALAAAGVVALAACGSPLSPSRPLGDGSTSFTFAGAPSEKAPIKRLVLRVDGKPVFDPKVPTIDAGEIARLALPKGTHMLQVMARVGVDGAIDPKANPTDPKCAVDIGFTGRIEVGARAVTVTITVVEHANAQPIARFDLSVQADNAEVVVMNPHAEILEDAPASCGVQTSVARVDCTLRRNFDAARKQKDIIKLNCLDARFVAASTLSNEPDSPSRDAKLNTLHAEIENCMNANANDTQELLFTGRRPFCE